jgi:hypothetical protein
VDDDTGWSEILVDGWGDLVRGAVVSRVERATVGHRGMLVRALADPDAARFAWTEQVHDLVLSAIREETGADLDALGSQAAWACYDDAWNALARRWRGGGTLHVVPGAQEHAVTALVRSLSPLAAEHAGADIGQDPWDLVQIDGRLLIDLEGLYAVVARDQGQLTVADRARIDQIIFRVRGG